MNWQESDDKSTSLRKVLDKGKVLRSLLKMVKTDGITRKGEIVRANLVKKFRKQIKSQKYEIKSGEIASRMAMELFASNSSIIKGPVK
jgi:hypothetical protein